jgi:hypothetical protein
MAGPLDAARLEAWGTAGSALLVTLAERGLALAGASLDAGEPHAPGPQWLALRRATLGVNLEFLQDRQRRLFWFFRGRPGADSAGHLVARARVSFALAPRLAPPPAPPPLLARLLPPMLAPLPASERARRFGDAGCVVFAANGQPFLAHAPGPGWLLPGGVGTGARLSRRTGLLLLAALAAARPSLTRAPAGSARAAGTGPALAERAAAVLAATHLAAESGMAALPTAPDAPLAGYGLDSSQAVIECALTDDGATPEPDDLAGALRMALSVAIAPEPSSGRVLIRLALSPPDVLAEGAVFDAFAAAIADAARDAAFAEAAGVPQALLRRRDRARLVMRFGPARDGFDRDLVAWQADGEEPALFTVAARVGGGNLAPAVALRDPEPVAGERLPGAVAARLAAIAGVLLAWAGDVA